MGERETDRQRVRIEEWGEESERETMQKFDNYIVYSKFHVLKTSQLIFGSLFLHHNSIKMQKDSLGLSYLIKTVKGQSFNLTININYNFHHPHFIPPRSL